MYARLTSYQCDPARLDDLTATLDSIRADIKAISGLVNVYSVWRGDGQGVTVAIYDSQASAEAAALKCSSMAASACQSPARP